MMRRGVRRSRVSRWNGGISDIPFSILYLCSELLMSGTDSLLYGLFSFPRLS
jgi:hypothetical protein